MPLHVVCTMQSIDIIRVIAGGYLFAKCIKDNDGNCPVHYLLMRSDLNSIEMLKLWRNLLQQVGMEMGATF